MATVPEKQFKEERDCFGLLIGVDPVDPHDIWMVRQLVTLLLQAGSTKRVLLLSLLLGLESSLRGGSSCFI